MKITFDPNKDAINQKKHGASLCLAGQIEWDSAVVWLDSRFAYDEPRMSGLGFVGLTLFYVAFVDEGDSRRIIHLRRATKLEVSRNAST